MIAALRPLLDTRRPDHRLRQRQLPRHPPARGGGGGAGLALPRRRRLRRRGGRAARAVDHGRRPEAGLGPGRADPRGDRGASSTARPAPTWMGADGAGHFVKTVHNGIEYADMQMIAEIYGIMRDGLGMEPEEVAMAFERWNGGPLKSYLIEITGERRPRHRPRHRPAGDRRHPRPRRAEGHRPLDRDRGAACSARPPPPSRRRSRRATSRRGSRSAQAGAALFGAAERARSRRPTALARPAGGGAARRQDRLLRPGLRPARRRRRRSSAGRCRWPAIARVWRAGCIIRSAMLDDMAQALGDDRGDEPDVRAALRRAARRDPRQPARASSPRRRCRRSRRRRSRRRSAIST